MIGCVPTDRVLIEHVATFGATTCAAHVPIFTPLSVNVTVPVGVPAPGAVTEIVAVNVTLTEGRTLTLQPRQGVVIPKGVMHRPRAPQRTVVLMVETKSIVPTGD